MLQISVPDKEYWDAKNEQFVTVKGQTLCLEHSLVSVSKWEAKFHKPFLSDENKTTEEIEYYVKCMTITQNVDDKVYRILTRDNYKDINDYISDSMTATTINDRSNHRSREIITSEVIYYWMVALNIPFECQKWHLNRLMMLIRVCNIKNQPSKKMSKAQTMKSNAALNAARRQKAHSKG